jgi:hypothetical protein
MYKHRLSDYERKEIARLSKREEDEPEFVTRVKKWMIAQIKAGNINEIDYDEWGEHYYLIDPDNSD